MKTIMILGAGVLQLRAIKTAKSLNLNSIVLDQNPRAPGMEIADVPIIADIKNPSLCLEIARQYRIDGVFTMATEVPLKSLAYINEQMGLSGLRPDQITAATDKGVMRGLFKKNGASSPLSVRCKTFEEAGAAFDKFKAEVIVKPALGMGSRGIFYLKDKQHLRSAFERAKANSGTGEVLVEEFIDGPEFSVETLSWNRHTEVVAVTDKITTGSPYWVEMGHTQPSEYSLKDIDAIKQTAIDGINALGLDWCAGHTEIKLSRSGPKLIEIGGRLGGDFITAELTTWSTGVDIVAGAIKLALGEAPIIEPIEPNRGAAIRYIGAKQGRLVRIDGLESARNIPGISTIEFNYQIGDQIPEVDSSGTRTAWIIAKCETRQQAIKACETAKSLIQITTE